MIKINEVTSVFDQDMHALEVKVSPLLWVW